MRACLPGFIEADAEVLDHPVDGKAEIKLIRQHRLAAVDHLPAHRRAAGNRRQHRVHIKPGTPAEIERFRQPLHKPANTDLVDHLGLLPRPGAADPPHRFAKGSDHWFSLGISRFITAAHDRQNAAFRPGLATGNRRIDKAEPHRHRHSMQLDRHISGGRGVINEDGA